MVRIGGRRNWIGGGGTGDQCNGVTTVLSVRGRGGRSNEVRFCGEGSARCAKVKCCAMKRLLTGQGGKEASKRLLRCLLLAHSANCIVLTLVFVSTTLFCTLACCARGQLFPLVTPPRSRLVAFTVRRSHIAAAYNSTRGSRPQRSDVAYRQIAGASANPLTPTKTAIHRVRMSPLLSAVGTQQQQQPIVPTTLARCSIPGPCYYRPVGAIGQVCAHARVTSERISEQQEEVTSDQNI